jgi:multiple sugar transport system permease protein
MKAEYKINKMPSKIRGMSKKKVNDYVWAYLMILPIVIGLFIFYIIPFFQTFFYSFTNMGAFGVYDSMGLNNFKKVLFDANFFLALKNTFVFTVISVPIGVILSILLAVLLNASIKGLTVYRTIYFLPAVTMPAAVAMVWKWLFNGDYGLINFMLSKIAIKGPAWISDPKIALFSIIMVGVWSKIGYNMVILLAGLQGISKSYYEAAEIDGAGGVGKFFNITLPLLSPTIFFVVVMSLIGAFQVFDYIFMMISTNSVALEATQSVVYLFYRSAFNLQEKGYASAIAIVLFFIIMAITAVQITLQKKWVNYE